MHKKFIQNLTLTIMATGFLAFNTQIAQSATAGSSIIKIKTAAELDNYVGKGKVTVVFFSSLTCNPCKMFHPSYEQLAQENPDVTFVEVTYGVVSGCDLLLNKYNIRGFPGFVFFDKDGNKTDSFSGAGERTKDKIQLAIMKAKSGTVSAQPAVSAPQPAAQQPQAQRAVNKSPVCPAGASCPMQSAKPAKQKKSQEQAAQKTKKSRKSSAFRR